MEIILIDYIIPVVVALIGAILSGIAAYIAKLTKGYVSENTLRKLAEDAVMAIEEKATAYAESRGERITGHQKLDQAIAYLLDKSPGLTKEQAEALAQSAVDRLPWLGSTGHKK